MKDNTQVSSGSDWKRVLWICAAVFSGLFIPAIFSNLSRAELSISRKPMSQFWYFAPWWESSPHHFRRPILRFLYYSVAVLFYVSLLSLHSLS